MLRISGVLDRGGTSLSRYRPTIHAGRRHRRDCRAGSAARTARCRRPRPIGISGSGSVTIISARAATIGTLIAEHPASWPICGPAAITSCVAANAPRSVHTAVTLPPVVIEALHGGVLQHATTVILHRPCIGLHCAVRIGVAAEVVQIAAGDVVARQRHQLAHLAVHPVVQTRNPAAPHVAAPARSAASAPHPSRCECGRGGTPWDSRAARPSSATGAVPP